MAVRGPAEGLLRSEEAGGVREEGCPLSEGEAAREAALPRWVGPRPRDRRSRLQGSGGAPPRLESRFRPAVREAADPRPRGALRSRTRGRLPMTRARLGRGDPTNPPRRAPTIRHPRVEIRARRDSSQEDPAASVTRRPRRLRRRRPAPSTAAIRRVERSRARPKAPVRLGVFHALASGILATHPAERARTRLHGRIPRKRRVRSRAFRTCGNPRRILPRIGQRPRR